MSLSIVNRPVHQVWHDLESFFWIWIYHFLRHSADVHLEDARWTNSQRGDVISFYFGGGNLQELAINKKELFKKSLHVEGCPKTQKYMELIQLRLCRLYDAFSKLDLVEEELKKHPDPSGNEAHYESLGGDNLHYSVENTVALGLLIDARGRAVQNCVGQGLFGETDAETFDPEIFDGEPSKVVSYMEELVNMRKRPKLLAYATFIAPLDDISEREERTGWHPVKRMTRGDAYNPWAMAVPTSRNTSTSYSISISISTSSTGAENSRTQKKSKKSTQPAEGGVSTRAHQRGHDAIHVGGDVEQSARLEGTVFSLSSLPETKRWQQHKDSGAW